MAPPRPWDVVAAPVTVLEVEAPPPMARVEAAWPEPAARVAMVVANRMVLSINAFLLSLRKIPREFLPFVDSWQQSSPAFWQARHWPKHDTSGAGRHNDYRAGRGR